MAKKGEITENQENEEPKETPAPKATPKKSEPVDIMDPSEAHEPPPPKEKKAKGQQSSDPVDLSPIMETIDKGFKELGEAIKPKSSPKTKEPAEADFLAPLGDW